MKLLGGALLCTHASWLLTGLYFVYPWPTQRSCDGIKPAMSGSELHGTSGSVPSSMHMVHA